MSCDVGEVIESLENELCSFSLTSPGEPPMIDRLWNDHNERIFSVTTLSEVLMRIKFTLILH